MSTQINESSNDQINPHQPLLVPYIFWLLLQVLALSPVLAKFFHYSVFPNNPARGTYNPQTFTVNSESRIVRLSGAVTATSNFGNTRTKNKKEKNQHWHIVNLQTFLT